MRRSLHSLTVKAKADFQQRPRAEWIRKWPGQLVISVSQIYWTQVSKWTLVGRPSPSNQPPT
jgi:hypothetical protein